MVCRMLAATALLGLALSLPSLGRAAGPGNPGLGNPGLGNPGPGNPGPGDPGRGRLVYGRCMACHSIARNAVGPRHAGLFGRKAGSLPDYDYSAAMRRSGIIWDATTLDAFIRNPQAAVPGTKMPFAGIADDQERADLIAYLRQATKTPAP